LKHDLTKTSLTAYEKQLVADPQVLLAKNAIIQKVYDLFGGLSEAYKREFTNHQFSDYINLINPKISRGENYLGLPYVILDYPRQFSKTDIFAIRSFFWWGNFFSITLHLSGCYQNQYAHVIENAIDKNVFSGWSLGVGQTQWDHHFEPNNYVSLSVNKPKISELTFIKLAKKIPLTEWDKADTFFIESFLLLMKTLSTHAPIR